MAKTKRILILSAIAAANALLAQFPLGDLLANLGSGDSSKGPLGDIARDSTHVDSQVSSKKPKKSK